MGKLWHIEAESKIAQLAKKKAINQAKVCLSSKACSRPILPPCFVGLWDKQAILKIHKFAYCVCLCVCVCECTYLNHGNSIKP